MSQSGLRQHIGLLLRYLKPLRLKMALLALFLLSAIALQIANPLIIRLFIDAVVAGGGTQQLLVYALVFLGASLLLQVMGVTATYIGEDVGWRATNQMRKELALHCLGLDMAFHDANPPGALIERIDGDVTNIARFFSQLFVRILGNLLLLLGVLVVLTQQSWQAGVALMISVTIGMVVLSFFRQIAVPYWKAARQASADQFAFIEEQLTATEDIRSCGAVDHVVRRLLGLCSVRLARELKSSTMNTVIAMVWIALYTLGQIIAFITSYMLHQRGLITLGSVYVIVFFSHFAFQRLLEIAAELQALQQAVASIERVRALMGETSRIVEKERTQTLSDGPLGVHFDRVSFSYVDGEEVLRDVEFQLEPGKVLGILGRTGSGKTTMTRLLARLYDPIRGTVRIGTDGTLHDLRDLGVQELRRRIGTVTQNVQLFEASLRDNMVFFDTDTPEEKVREALDTMGFSSWIEAQPEGLATRLESEGRNLSAGEAQMLAFTRVFLGDPGLVILDEASSRLDPGTERYIEQAIDRLLKNRTAIIIAHRMRTVQRADDIMIIENGRILEHGAYKALAEDPGSRFHQLLQSGLEEYLV